MLRRLYDWTLECARHRRASHVLGAVAFAESSFFPIPPDVLLIPMALAERARAWLYAAITTLCSVAGGLAGYAIGYFLFEAAGRPLLEFYGLSQDFTEFAARYNASGAWVVFTAGLTPFPFKIITIASGATALNLWIFVIASLAARGLRFFAVAAALYWFGPPIRGWIERYLGLATILFVILLIGGFAAIKYLL